MGELQAIKGVGKTVLGALELPSSRFSLRLAGERALRYNRYNI